VKSYGKQPAHRILLAQGRTIEGTARAMGINPNHLHHALRGNVRPSAYLREQLPIVLGVPLHELFDRKLLDRPLDRRMPDQRVAS
jgi:transcriptional regulator with XRE-family HTH domain